MKKLKTKKRKVNPIFIICFAILCIVATYSFSKYVIQLSQIHIQNADEFYFESNVLDIEDKQYVLNDWDGVSNYLIKFDLCNYADELRINQDDITYKIDAKSKTDGINVDVKSNVTGNLIGKVKSEKQIEIIMNSNKTFNKEEYAEIELTATSTAPYEKILTATFKIYVASIKNYEVELKEDEDYVNIYISSYDFDKNLKITYDNTKLIPDTSCTDMQNVDIIDNYFIMALKKRNQYKIGFVKKNSSDKITMGTSIIISNQE